MKHDQVCLASLEGFGSIYGCSCGLYHIHLTGMTVHLNKKGFDRLVHLVFQAKEEQDLFGSNKTTFKKNSLVLVKH